MKDKALSATEHLMSESDILKEIEVRWGNKEDLITEIQKDIDILKPCNQENKEFITFVDTLRGLYSDIQQIGMSNELSNIPMLNQIIKKLHSK